MEWGYVARCDLAHSTNEDFAKEHAARMGLASLLSPVEEESKIMKFIREKLGVYYAQYGRFCSRHPWEIIVTFVTLTVVVLSMSILNGGKFVIPCGRDVGCVDLPSEKSFDQEEMSEVTEGVDFMVMTAINCFAVVYVYTQFRTLSKTGSKYILGVCGMFIIFSSFVFGIGVTYLTQRNISILSEGIPFILIIIDLSKATQMAKFAMTSKDKAEVEQNIGTALAYLGPSLTLDTLVTALAVGVGVMSGVEKLELICFFGCATILSNFVVFVTFFPATLALAMEVCPSNPTSYWRLDDFLRDMQEEKKKQPNPVVQRVKLIMSLGLVAVHLHSHSGFLTQVTGVHFPELFSGQNMHSMDLGTDHMEVVPFHQFLLWKLLHLSKGQVVTLLLAIILVLKYIIFDKPGKVSNTDNLNRRTRFSIAPEEDSGKELQSILKKNGGSHYNGGSAPKLGHFEDSLALSPAFLREVLKENFQSCNSSSASLSYSPQTEEQEDGEPDDKEDSSDTQLNQEEEQTKEPIFQIGSGLDSRRASVVETFPEPVGVTEPETFEQDTSKVLDGEDQRNKLEDTTEQKRTLNECASLLAAGRTHELSDEEVIGLVEAKRLPAYKLETALGDPERGVSIRRCMLEQNLPEQSDMSGVPYKDYDYSKVMGSCCENVIGYMPVPVGVAGPLLLDGEQFHVPMATTEGCLVASTNRGCRAIASAGGVRSYVVGDGMTRAPVIRMPSAAQATALKLWFDNYDNFDYVQECFNSTSRFAKLQSITVVVAGRLVYVRFKASTGDAMGMNMISKGVEHTLKRVQDDHFPDMQIVSLSGNFCVDKKPSAINWIEGRGKSVVCEAIIPGKLVKDVLKTEVQALVEVNVYKNLVGSAMAGSIGGYNAHAANIVTAIYIATGQDPAQNVGSSNCLTMMETCGLNNSDLRISCTMPSIEVGTVGGGTLLTAQEACLKMLGVQGSNDENPGLNAAKLARIVCGTVLAGELSLISALAAGHLVRSHMTHNRSRTSLGSIKEMPMDVNVNKHKRSNSDVFK